MFDKQYQATIDVICDLRKFSQDVNDIGTMELLWQQISPQIVGHPIIANQPIEVNVWQSSLSIWVIEANGFSQIDKDAAFKIIDVVRNPKLIYKCRICGEYGPLRCLRCEDEKRPERLCAKDAYTLRDELSAYCLNHLPNCSCRNDCTQKVTFRCRHCRKLFGDHICRRNPRDDSAEYCDYCYRNLFEQCITCKQEGKFRLGKSKCAFKNPKDENSCGLPLCWDHGYQWKIWGPHNRGVTLCAHHKQLLNSNEPNVLLFMMITAKAPYAQRGRRQLLPNPFRLRRIINRDRSQPLSFENVNLALRSLSAQIDSVGEYAKRNYERMCQNYNETIAGLGQIEADLTSRIKAFYQAALGWEAVSQIARVEIVDRFSKPGQFSSYRIHIQFTTSVIDKGRFIGWRGKLIGLLRGQLHDKYPNIQIDI